MLGGVTIETEAQARAYTAAMRAHPSAWTPRDLDPASIQPGEDLELEPCVGPDHLQRFGRECPRAELHPENEVAARLAFASLGNGDHTRGLMPVYVEALLADMAQDQARTVVLRAFRALQSDAVVNWLKAQRAPKDEE
jgi:hypothetical protein